MGNDWNDNAGDTHGHQYSYNPQDRGPYNTPDRRPYGVPQEQITPQRKPRKAGRLVIAVVAGVVAAILVVGVMTSLMFDGTVGTIDVSGTNPPPSVPGPKVPQPTPKPTAKPKTWHTLATFKGSADKASDTIKTTGGRVRLVYTFKGSSDFVMGAVYFLQEGHDLNTDGGIPDVMVDAPGKDSTILRKTAGSYYLQVSSANTTWTITVQEER